MTRATLVLVAILALPLASAAGMTLGASRTLEADVDGSGVAVFAMPITIEQDGEVYAKLLNTPDNAAMHEQGWSIEHALVAADGNRTPMGGALDGTSSEAIPVRAGQALTFLTTLQPPRRASAEASVFVALAFRTGASGNATQSGATMDEARGLTLLVRGIPTLAADDASAPTGTDETTRSPTPPVEPLVIVRPPATAPDASAQSSATKLTTALLALIVVALAAVAIALVAASLALVLLVRELRAGREARAGVSIAVRSAPVRDEELESLAHERR